MSTFTKASFDPNPNQRELDNQRIAYEAACEAVVLLRNDGALPFSTRKIALYGSGAIMTVKGGTGSGEVNERRSVNIYEGLCDRGFIISSHKWLNDYKQYYKEAEAAYKIEKRKRLNIFHLKDIMQMLFDNFKAPAGRAISPEDLESSDTDSCIYVLSRQAGEGGDRKLEKGDFLLSDEELAHIRFCAENYSKFVLVVNSGSAIDVSFADEIPGINALVYICQLGTEGGHALADIVSGDVSPSGKLSDTWAKKYSDFPFSNEYSYINGNLQKEFYKEGIYVGYRYFDSFGTEPAFPFGYGLSYTEFTINPESLSSAGSNVKLDITVKNCGQNFSGKEVAQLYVSCPSGKLSREYQSLAAYGKSKKLAPNESQRLELSFDIRQLAAYNENDSCYILEKGRYILRLGNSSRSTNPVGSFVIEKDICVSKHTAVCRAESHISELEHYSSEDEITAELPCIVFSPDCMECKEYKYDVHAMEHSKKALDFVESLSVEDMCEIVVGCGMFGAKRKFDLPGSVGNTTSKFWDKGLCNVALCDGPAGLRLQKRSTIDEKGNIKPLEMALSVFNAFPNFIKKFMLGDENKNTVIYQFTTAFPVANALAQTWNLELMHKIGTAIANEMKEYGCTFWLAPAINIHRNPLCGRNFEYFSEDPLLAGKMAAAITKAVQHENGLYVTIKHFACNNQEDNRNYVSSEVDERSLREIYLRPFEICVREGGAKAVMTSYNKINGIYTSNSHDLCTKILRSEWAFNGVVMTDWFSTNPGQASSAIAMQAGNDLIMPGGKSFRKNILSGIKKGTITVDDLRRCCLNVVNAIMNSQIQKEYIESKSNSDT